jgi:hypothetical protein
VFGGLSFLDRHKNLADGAKIWMAMTDVVKWRFLNTTIARSMTMKLKSGLAVFLCVLASAVAGCSDDSGGGGGNGGGGGGSSVASYDNFQEQASEELIQLICTATFDCPEKQSPWLAFSVGRFDSKQACISGAADVLDISAGDDETRAAIEAGRLNYDAAAAQSCISAVEQATSTCPAFTELQKLIEGPECQAFLIPQQEEGDACLGDQECISGNCDSSQAAGECYGRCGAAIDPAQEGESCGAADCADGLICAGGSGGSTCIQENSRIEGEACEGSGPMCADGLVCGLDGTCVPQLSYGAQGETCSTTGGLCEPGLVCADLQPTGADSVEGTCASPRAQGEDCQQTFQCAIGFYCDGATGLTQGTCEEPKQAGEACSGSDEGCAGDLRCDSSGGSPVCAAQSEPTVCEIPDESGNNGGGNDTGTTDTGPDAG